MPDAIYEVVERFDPSKDYGIKIRDGIVKCLLSMEPGQRFVPNQFVKDNLNKFTKGYATLSLKIGKIHV